jgi:hypothetical protein
MRLPGEVISSPFLSIEKGWKFFRFFLYVQNFVNIFF